MHRRIILVIPLRRIKRLQRHHLRHNRLPKNFRLIQLRNVSLGNLLLLIIPVENHRPVLRAFIRPLPVHLRRIERHREEHPQQLSISHLRRIVNNLHRLRMSGLARCSPSHNPDSSPSRPSIPKSR